MRYRNDLGYPVTVQAETTVLLEPGDEYESEDHVTGLTPLDEKPEPEPPAKPEPVPVEHRMSAEQVETADKHLPPDQPIAPKLAARKSTTEPGQEG